MALGKSGIKRPRLVSFGRESVEESKRREVEEEEEEEEEEEGEKFKQRSIKVWKLNLCMELWVLYGCLDFGLELYGFVWISCLDICLWVVGCRKPNPRMNLCMEIPLFL